VDASTLRPALVLSVWTLLVWTTRIRNIWTDESLSTSGQVFRTVLAGVFTAFALATVATWIRARRGTATVPAWAPALIRTFALWTAGVWLVRGTQIALGDHSASFVVVHTVLALVSTALAAWAWAAVSNRLSDPGRRPAPASGSGTRHRP
jgi:hypothetical protein